MSSFFDSDNLKRMAGAAKAATATYAASAAAAARSAASEASKMAAHASEHAVKAATAAARDAMGGSPALALVGSELTVSGQALMVDSLLAEGGFASVYSVTVLGTGEKRVLKKMYAAGAEVTAQLTGEVELMKRVTHPGIVHVYGSETRPVGRDGLEIYVLMELCPGGHLLARMNKLLESKRSLPPEKVLEVFASIVRPVGALHALSPPVAHRDLKFENILIAGDGSLRLCDFGSASTWSGVPTSKSDRAEQEDAITRFTTPHFRSPEMVDLYAGMALDTRSDIWALGCMLYGLAYLKHPFQEGGNLAILAGKFKIPYQPPYPPPIITLIKSCCAWRPEERPTAVGILDYIAACQACPATGPWPALMLSGGGSAVTAGLAPPPHDSPTADGVVVGGDAGTASSVAADTARAAVAATKAASLHRPTAAEIAASIAPTSTAAAPSSALAKRLGKRGGAAPAPAPVAAPLAAPPRAASPPITTPAAAAVDASGGGTDLDASVFFAAAAAAPAAASSRMAQPRRPSGDASPAPAPTIAPARAFQPSSYADEFDAFSAGAASGGDFDAFAAAPAPPPTATRVAAHAPAPANALDDLFAAPPPQRAAASAGLDDLFAAPATSPAPASVNINALYATAPGMHISSMGAPMGMMQPHPAGGVAYSAPAGYGAVSPPVATGTGPRTLGGAPVPAPAPAASGKRDPFGDLLGSF